MGTAYTEADAKRDARAVEWNFVRGENFRGVHIENGVVTDPAEALQRLLAAALEGAKVPGLVAQLADRDADVKASEGLRLAATERADRLQAQMATLTTERDAYKEIAKEVKSERDALRAQVAKLRSILAEYVAVDGSQGLCSAMRLGKVQERARSALSAPPAETTKAEPHCGNCGESEEVHPTFCNEPAETMPAHCPKCDMNHPGPTNPCVLCEAHAAYSAEQSAKDDAEMAAEAATERKEWGTPEAPVTSRLCTACGMTLVHGHDDLHPWCRE